jgi:hypothetical protein
MFFTIATLGKGDRLVEIRSVWKSGPPVFWPHMPWSVTVTGPRNFQNHEQLAGPTRNRSFAVFCGYKTGLNRLEY